ncbi:Meiotic recombination protein SPO11 [Liparis tanakae]|uniref:DNA topoisomerase (ATP-hydrolyzing) n=1 Tax=Liparis tanakae TaxID=230148 RepID=A0A4Z2FX28_9TELE|nr:Meiotic recombination protein SPO11 [Liparis tanakae]
MMASRTAEPFSEVDKLRTELLNNVELMTDCLRVEEEISNRDILTRIENVILGIVTSLSKDEAPVLALPNRSSWANISAVGLQMSPESSVTTVRSDCPSSATKFDIVSSAKFVMIVEKDATFQRLLDDDFCTKMSPCIMITGKGVPDLNSRLMVRKLWDALHVPVFALVDADPHGIEIMCIYKYGSVSMSFEARSLTVPSVMWLGLLPTDLKRLRVPEDSLIPLTRTDESKLCSLLKRPYVTGKPDWQREMELMQQSKVKAEIQSLAAIAPDFLTSVYLPNKLRYGGWV